MRDLVGDNRRESQKAFLVRFGSTLRSIMHLIEQLLPQGFLAEVKVSSYLKCLVKLNLFSVTSMNFLPSST